MNEKIMILNLCRYTDKLSGAKKLFMQYILQNEDAVANNDNYVGCSVLEMNLENGEKWDELKPYVLTTLTMSCEIVSNVKNPLKPKVRLIKFTDKNGKIINMV